MYSVGMCMYVCASWYEDIASNEPLLLKEREKIKKKGKGKKMAEVKS